MRRIVVLSALALLGAACAGDPLSPHRGIGTSPTAPSLGIGTSPSGPIDRGIGTSPTAPTRGVDTSPGTLP